MESLELELEPRFERYVLPVHVYDCARSTLCVRKKRQSRRFGRGQMDGLQTHGTGAVHAPSSDDHAQPVRSRMGSCMTVNDVRSDTTSRRCSWRAPSSLAWLRDPPFTPSLFVRLRACGRALGLCVRALIDAETTAQHCAVGAPMPCPVISDVCENVCPATSATRCTHAQCARTCACARTKVHLCPACNHIAKALSL